MTSEMETQVREVLGAHFYEEYSFLVNKYLNLAEGLPRDGQIIELLHRLSDAHSVVVRPNLRHAAVVHSQRGMREVRAHGNVLKGLNCESADRLYLNSKKVFERKGGEWVYVGD